MKKITTIISLAIGSLLLWGCTATGGVATNLGERAVNDIVCSAALASASTGNPASLISATQACGKTLDQIREDLEAGKSKVQELKK